jgi:hypothetical protein
VLCEETGASPDPENDAADLDVEIDLSRCAVRYGAREGAVWFAEVSDTLEEDVCTIDVAELRDAEGGVIGPAGALPVAIPDADPAGVILVFDVFGPGAPGAGTPAPGAPVPGSVDGATIVLDVRHPYRGDLAVVAGVAPAASADDPGSLCETVAIESDELDDAVNLHASIDVSECAAFGFGADVCWFVTVVDELPEDVGTIVAARLVLASGTVYRPTTESTLPLAIPDAQPVGVTVSFQTV